ncbi:hypothetical protein GR160_16730 [Flavobacterium sp. Sd200]|uniref:hypothetical protein n=1 Tax=Flavobacterium sp. Sd200 TaxID=2692211 RepID=UPI0013689F85|nr:hypothetical protein [Flavobacterium sp. Sd200]MXN92874.1 hypothetical protein [Flavobacterium sp. Sd200]
MKDITSEILEKYQLKLNESPALEDSFSKMQLDSYLKAASVLHCFVPELLFPLDASFSHQTPRVLLFDYITSLAGGLSEGLFTLKSDIRQKKIEEFASKSEMQVALKANPNRPQTDLQKMWEEFLVSGVTSPIDGMGFKELTNLSQIISWFAGNNKQLPSEVDVNILLTEKGILSNFEHLLISNFTGRVNEMAELRNHIELNARSGISEMSQKVYNWLFKEKKLIMAINGPGGIGKSALVGRILWECAQQKKDKRPPFAYLPFDQSTLRIESPFTILVEIAAQLRLQLPQHESRIDYFNSFVRDFRKGKDDLNIRSVSANTRSERIDRYHDNDYQLYREFGKLLSDISLKNGSMLPVIVVFDTFEEVQFRDRESLQGFWRMLDIVYSEFPNFRVIIAGRSPIIDSRISTMLTNELSLEQLSEEDSVSLLKRLGVQDNSIAHIIAKQIGGNPLSLRLAANLAAAESNAIGKKGIENLNTTKWLFFQLDEELIQGQLYQRLLNHIHDDDVRKLAHPGMVLRKTSPEIILAVLAPVCGLQIDNLEEAVNLFEELRREHSLVRTSESGVLEYRPEIRRAMIRLLKQDKFAEVKRINEEAVWFYERKEGTANRAEEIYHRLILDKDDFYLLDNRWVPGIEQSIFENLDEYSDRIKVWLSSRLNLEVSRDIFRSADLNDWERNVTRKVKRALTELDVKGALFLLQERTDRSTDSPVFALEAKAYMLNNDTSHAAAVLEQGINTVSGSANRGRLAELLWLQAQLALLSDNPVLAADYLGMAAESVQKAVNPIPEIQILSHRILIEQFYSIKVISINKFMSRLKTLCDGAKADISRDVFFVLQLAFFLLRDEYPAIASDFPNHRSDFTRDEMINLLTTENLRGLNEYRNDWENEGDNLTFESYV